MFKRHKLLILALLIGAAIYGIFFAIDIANQPPDDSSVELSVAPVVRKLMVLDLGNRGHINQEGILSGEDPVLALREPIDARNSQQFVLEYVDSFDRLLQLDDNKADGQINAGDAIYPSLVLVFFDQSGKPTRLVSLPNAGVRAIYWRRRFLTRRLSNLADRLLKDQHIILMSDGTKRKVRIIPVDETVLLTGH